MTPCLGATRGAPCVNSAHAHTAIAACMACRTPNVQRWTVQLGCCAGHHACHVRGCAQHISCSLRCRTGNVHCRPEHGCHRSCQRTPAMPCGGSCQACTPCSGHARRTALWPRLSHDLHASTRLQHHARPCPDSMLLTRVRYRRVCAIRQTYNCGLHRDLTPPAFQ